MNQVQYPSDYVSADGKWYPTVGEAFRNGSGVPKGIPSNISLLTNLLERLSNEYSEIIVDKLTITSDAEGTISYVSELNITYNVFSTYITTGPKYVFIDIIILRGSANPSNITNVYSSKGLSTTGRTYLTGANFPNSCTVNTLIILGVIK